MIEIRPFNEDHQGEIDKMMAEIALEFQEPIFFTTSKKMKEVAYIPTNKFWVALRDSQVIGTIGLMSLSNRVIVLKSMFLVRNFRGRGISNLLLATLKEWCHLNEFKTIYLGTMEQFKAAHKFYEKNGFQQITKKDLPSDFINNPVDAIFYKLELKDC